jgi:hypothetical protein
VPAGSDAADAVAVPDVTAPPPTALRHVVPVVAVVVAVQVLFVALRLLALGGDITSFTDGYDGRAYYRLALDPLTLQIADHGIAFTRPAYWQTRIGYPVTAWAMSLGGRADLVPAALVVANLLAVAAIALLACRLALNLGRSAWWGAVPAMWAGLLVGVGQDLTEPLAGLLLLAALAWIRSGREVLAAGALTAAALTRETTLVVAVAVLLTGTRAPRWWVGAVPLVAYAGWRTWVRARWSDVVPDPPSDNPLGWPGLELARYLGSAVTHPVAEAPNLVLLVASLLALALAATGLRSDGPRHEKLALVVSLLVLASLPVWDRGQAYLRWGCEPFLIGWLLLARGAGSAYAARIRAALVPVVAVLWLVAATQSLAYPLTEGRWSGWWTWS